MGILNLLKAGKSKLGWNGGTVPSTNPSLQRHDSYSIDGSPNIELIGAGFSPIKPAPSKLDEADKANTSKYRNRSGEKYTDNLPK